MKSIEGRKYQKDEFSYINFSLNSVLLQRFEEMIIKDLKTRRKHAISAFYVQKSPWRFQQFSFYTQIFSLFCPYINKL